jgi:hypothetical protein
MVKSNNDYKDDKLSLFDFANIINLKQIDKLEFNNIYNIGYSPYLMNKLYSNIPDTVFYANIINVDCDEQYNFDFYYYGLSKSKRFGKWHKKQKQNMKEESIINNIMEYYNYSKSQSQEIYNIFVQHNLLNIFQTLIEKGGKNK